MLEKIFNKILDNSRVQYRKQYHFVDFSLDEWFSKKNVYFQVYAYLDKSNDTSCALKKDKSALTVRNAYLFNPIFKKEDAYKKIGFPERYFFEPCFRVDIEFLNKKDSYKDISKQLKKKIIYKSPKSEIKKFDRSRELSLGKFLKTKKEKTNIYLNNKLIFNSVNNEFINDLYEILKLPNGSIFIELWTQKINSTYLIYDFYIKPNFDDEYGEYFERYSNDFLGARYHSAASDRGKDHWKLNIK